VNLGTFQKQDREKIHPEGTKTSCAILSGKYPVSGPGFRGARSMPGLEVGRKTMTMCTALRVAAVASAAAACSASAQIMQDGNMNSLAVGTAPDNMVAAGAWAFPANYVSGGVAEPVASPGIFSIVPTSSFDPLGSGNSLRLNNPTGGTADNWHLPNVWSPAISAAPGLIVRATFNLWVDAGNGGGGSIYIGGDNGGGGFSNATDRTAQLTWLPDGTLNAANGSGVNVPMANYGRGAWQNIQIDIDTNARNFDLFWSMGANPLAQIGNDLPFRAITPALSVLYDRFTYVQFGGTVGNAVSAIDNIVITTIPAPGSAALLGLGGLVAFRRRRN
jgi:hypothetical protein